MAGTGVSADVEVADRIASVTLDRASSSVICALSNGRAMRTPLPPDLFNASSQLERVTYVPARQRATLRTIRGDEVEFEVPTSTGVAPAAGRTVVYLDQKDWSTLANAVSAPQRVSETERKAALRIVGLVQDGKLLLPLSSAHIAETCKWTNADRRYALALTMLQFSAGWQLRDVLAVRRDEIRSSLHRIYRDEAFQLVPTITLQPFAIHEARLGGTRLPSQPTPSTEIEFAIDALTNVVATADTLLDGASVPMDPVSGWTQRQQAFTQHVAGLSQDSRQKRKLIKTFFITDTPLELAEGAVHANVSQAEFEEWIQTHSDNELAAMPSLGLFREVMCEKHLDPGTKWADNDLGDMMYLTCGAAYADFVVCERVHGSTIRQSLRRLGRRDNVVVTLNELDRRLAQAGL